jgi:RNA polymerase sigma-70 factor (ECF subfamily)
MMSPFDHLKYKEIAHQLDLSPKTLECQISLALDKLRRLIPTERWHAAKSAL